MTERSAFVLHVRPDKLDEYVKAHAEVWPELLEALTDAGIRNYSIFRAGTDVFGYFEADDSAAAQAYMEAQPVNSRWQDHMAELLQERVPDAGAPTLEEIFRLDGSPASSRGRAATRRPDTAIDEKSKLDADGYLVGLDDKIREHIRTSRSVDELIRELSWPEKRAVLLGVDHVRYLEYAERPRVPYDDFVVSPNAQDLRVRVYNARGHEQLPCIVRVHGGGFMFGSIDNATSRDWCADVAFRVGAVVVDVEYRLAPEHTFPTAPEDVYQAYTWVTEQAQALRIDASRIAVSGESAGGNLAAVVSMMVRDRGGLRPLFQLLEVPVVDQLHEPTYRSIRECGIGAGLTVDGLRELSRIYMADARDWRHPYASPILGDLRDLPATHLMLAEFDPLRDPGLDFGEKLAAAGVATTWSVHPGQWHGTGVMDPSFRPAAAWRNEVIDTLRAALVKDRGLNLRAQL